IIGLFSVAGEKYFGEDQFQLQFASDSRTRQAPVSVRKRKPAGIGNQTGHKPASKPPVRSPHREPSYQPLSAQGRDKESRHQLL
ncbi:MAG: hypothetical protein MUO54_15210, partial [Anaerolineales bacterium]|nr:hypothetical protein [Anaerolineales bacterium]